MRIATSANARTAKAVEKSTGSGLRVAFNSGVVMGLIVVGLGVLGVSIFYRLEWPKIVEKHTGSKLQLCIANLFGDKTQWLYLSLNRRKKHD